MQLYRKRFTDPTVLHSHATIPDYNKVSLITKPALCHQGFVISRGHCSLLVDLKFLEEGSLFGVLWELAVTEE